MNKKKLILGIIAITIIGWSILKFCNHHNLIINVIVILIQIFGYYIVIRNSIIKTTNPKFMHNGLGNCPNHDWKPSEWDSTNCEMCVKCGAIIWKK